MTNFKQFMVDKLENVGVFYAADEDVFTGYVFFDAKLGIVGFGVEQYSGCAPERMEHVFIDFDCKVEVETAKLAILDFAERTVNSKSFYEKEMARVRLGLMLKGYIKPMAS